MMKKVFLGILIGLFLLSGIVLAEGKKAEIIMFYSESCPHCHDEMRFLDELEEKYEDLVINRYNIAEKESIDLLKKLYKEYEVPESEWGLIPATFLKEKYLVGYGGDDITGKEIENCVKECLTQEGETGTSWMEASVKKITLPLVGEIEVSNFSPLILAIIFGALDGFNACAMVALGFLLSVLISSGTRKRIILIGGTFILVSGFVYFLFISAWLNLFLVTFNIKFITNIVSVIIILSAIFILRDYFTGAICKLCEVDPEKQGFLVKIQQKLFTKMQQFSSADMPLPIALLGIAIVAAGVNMVELACSFGLPLAFTKILIGLNLSKASYYFYLLVYIIFYMIDDFIIFLIAVYTLRTTQASEKYLKVITLISGLVLLALGFAMLFKPELLIL